MRKNVFFFQNYYKGGSLYIFSIYVTLVFYINKNKTKIFIIFLCYQVIFVWSTSFKIKAGKQSYNVSSSYKKYWFRIVFLNILTFSKKFSPVLTKLKCDTFFTCELVKLHVIYFLYKTGIKHVLRGQTVNKRYNLFTLKYWMGFIAAHATSVLRNSKVLWESRQNFCHVNSVCV